MSDGFISHSTFLWLCAFGMLLGALLCGIACLYSAIKKQGLRCAICAIAALFLILGAADAFRGAKVMRQSTVVAPEVRGAFLFQDRSSSIFKGKTGIITRYEI